MRIGRADFLMNRFQRIDDEQIDVGVLSWKRVSSWLNHLIVEMVVVTAELQ